MKILADTHILLWILSDDAQLSAKARKEILNPENEIYFSSISVWEIEIKHKIHPDQILIDGKAFTNYCKQSGFHPISFTIEHALLCESLNYPSSLPQHKDPFGKALLAQAKADGFHLMTHDSKICDYNETYIMMV